MSPEFKVGAHSYRAEPLGIFEQFDIARRLAPIVTLLTMQKDREKLQKGFARAFVSMSSGLSREDGQAILATCLGQISRKEGAAFAPVNVRGSMMFADITLEQSLELLWHALLASNLIDFFDVPL
jgi:hypothetical protein